MPIIDANALTRVGHVSFDHADTITLAQLYICTAIAFSLGYWLAKSAKRRRKK